MLWDPPTAPSSPSPVQTSGVYHRTHHPGGLSFIGAVPPSIDQALQDFNAWNRSEQGCFPSQPLRGPGQTGPPLPSLPDHFRAPDCPPPNHPPANCTPPDPLPPPISRKRKRTTSSDSAAAGGYGPIPGSPSEQTERSTPDPPPVFKSTGRKGSACEIWAFTRAVQTNEDVPAAEWPNDYNTYLDTRPDTAWVGCKICTEFGDDKSNIKIWKLFNNGQQTSPTSTLRRHFQEKHGLRWDAECDRIGVPRKRPTAEPLSWDGEPFTREGVMLHLQEFIAGDDESINVVESPRFRKLLLYFGQGRATDDEIPKRTHLTEGIIQAWKKEREDFHQEMKRSLGRVSLTTDGWSTPKLMSFLGATAHFIVCNERRKQLILRSGLLAFRHIRGSHTGEHLAEVLYKIIKKAGIEQRIGSITADNASNNDTMMEHLEAWFAKDNIPFDRHGNRVRCFPHVINLAVQAIYDALKDGKGVDTQYILGGFSHMNEDALERMVLPPGVIKEDYVQALTADVLGTARKLISACRVSGRRREEFVDTILQGNLDETWNDNDGNPISREALELLRDSDNRWSSTYLMVDRVLAMLPVIEVFSKRPDISDVNIPIPSAAEVCVLDHIRTVMSVPYDAQESLSSDCTPTLSYSLPFYHSIIDDWENLKEDYPLLSPFIGIGVNKVDAYINKSKLSRTYSLATLLNPCLKMEWIRKKCSADAVRETGQMALDAMRAFKKADLEVERESSAYTAVPAHSLKSIAASAKRFLDRGVNRTSASTQKLAGVTTLPRSPPDAGPVGRDVVLDGLRLELDTYLYEPRMDPFKKDPESDDRVVFCDPLQYWMGAEKRFPHLFRLAMDILPAQASAVACERLFSSSKETCTPRRNRINPDLMEALQTLKFSFRSGTLNLAKNMEDTLYLFEKDEQNAA